MDKRPNISATPASDGQFGNGKNIHLIKEISLNKNIHSLLTSDIIVLTRKGKGDAEPHSGQKKRVSKSPSKNLPKFVFKDEKKNLPHLKIHSYPTIRAVVPPTNASTISYEQGIRALIFEWQTKMRYESDCWTRVESKETDLQK